MKDMIHRLSIWGLIYNNCHIFLSLGVFKKKPIHDTKRTKICLTLVKTRRGGGEYFLVIVMGMCCAAGWGCIFTPGLTFLGLHFCKSY